MVAIVHKGFGRYIVADRPDGAALFGPATKEQAEAWAMANAAGGADSSPAVSADVPEGVEPNPEKRRKLHEAKTEADMRTALDGVAAKVRAVIAAEWGDDDADRVMIHIKPLLADRKGEAARRERQQAKNVKATALRQRLTQLQDAAAKTGGAQA